MLNIMSLPNTNCPGVFCKVVWNVDLIAKAIALRIVPFQGLSLFR
jgi:hypothetical protein